MICSQIRVTIIAVVATFTCVVGEAQTFRVALKSVPTSLDPDMYQDMSANLVLRQLFDVLFQESRGAWTPNKKLLRSWSASNDFTVFELCPQKGVKFTTGNAFNTEALQENIKLFAGKKMFSADLTETVVTKSECVTIKFADSYAGFPESLSELNAGIRDPATFKDSTPAGTTEYTVGNILPGKKVELRAKNNLSRKLDFSTVEFEEFNEQHLKLYHSIDSAFLGSPPRLDAETKKYFLRSTVPAPIGVYLAAGSASDSVRKVFRDCIDREKLGESFLGNNNYSIMNTFFPSWFGNRLGTIKNEKCRSEKQRWQNDVRIVFKQRKTDPEMQKRLTVALSAMQTFFPKLIVEPLSDDAYVVATNARKKNYDFALVMIASQRISYFLHRMLSASDGKTVTEVPESKSNEFQHKSSRTLEWTKKIVLLNEAAEFLQNGSYVTPIAEARATRYFSKKVAYPPASSFDSFTGFYIGDLKEQ